MSVVVDALGWLKDWNFVIPAGLWAGREAATRGRQVRLRRRLWRGGRKELLVVNIGEATFDRARLSVQGSVEEARSIQRVIDRARGLSLKPREVPIDDPGLTNESGLHVYVGSVRNGDRTATYLQTLCPSIDWTSTGFSVSGTQYNTELRLRPGGELSVTTDHGLIVVAPSLPMGQGWVMFLLGRYPSGSALAASWFAGQAKQISLLAVGGRWAAVISVDTVAGLTTASSISV